MDKHSPEPWRTFDCFGDRYAEVFGPDKEIVLNGDHAKADARRIVACVNMCAGIPTEEIEKFAEFQTAIGRVRSSGCKTNSSVLSLMQELTARQILGDRGYKIEDPHE